MSNSAKRNFNSTSAFKRELMGKDALVLECGLPRNRVTGAGKHLRHMAERQRLERAVGNLEALSCTPFNVGAFLKSASLNDINRLTGWFKAAEEYKPAKKLVSLLLIPERGMGSPCQKVSDLFWFTDMWASPNHVSWEQVDSIKWLIKATKVAMVEGVEWGNDKIDVTCIKNSKFLTHLDKVCYEHKFVLCWELFGTKTDITHRDLNWKLLRQIQGMWKVADYLPTYHSKWYRWKKSGLPHNREIVSSSINPREMKAKGVLYLHGKLEDELVENKDTITFFYDALYRLAFMFGNDINAMDKVIVHAQRNRGGKSWTMAMHDAAQALPFKASEKGWAAFVLTNHMHRFYATAMQYSHEIVQEMGRVPISVKDILSHPTASVILKTANLTNREKQFIKETETKGFEGCPQVKVQEGDYSIVKLDHDDATQITAGRLVNCCQHLDGAAASCAASAWAQGNAAIYALFKNNDMVAQSFAWRGKHGELVFDSVEALSCNNANFYVGLFIRAAKQCMGRLGIEQVLVGISDYGISSYFPKDKKVDTPKSTFNLGYSDASEGCYVICESENPKGFKLTKKAMALQAV